MQGEREHDEALKKVAGEQPHEAARQIDTEHGGVERPARDPSTSPDADDDGDDADA
jgi:hypothetical protein